MRSGELPLCIPFLEEHWRINSLYGFLEAVGRFNLCRTWEICQICDTWSRSRVSSRPPPRVSDISAFTDWAATRHADLFAPANSFIRKVIEVAQRDAGEVGSIWRVRWVKWCPRCASSKTHRAIHQHRAINHCPEHGDRLVSRCEYCGASSSYRVQRLSRLFECAQCESYSAAPLKKGSTQMQWQGPGEDPLQGPRYVQKLAEAVAIPGLLEFVADRASDNCFQAFSQDIRILTAERHLGPNVRSESSKVLGRYFRFGDAQLAMSSIGVSEGDSDRAVLSVLREVGTLAILARHPCVADVNAIDDSDFLDCPCGVGFRLWRGRVRSGSLKRFDSMFSRMTTEAYEESHLGLCLSVAWFASVQSKFVGGDDVYKGLLKLLVPLPWDVDPGVALSVARDRTPVTLSHRFQWFSVRCSHGSARVKRRLDQLGAGVGMANTSEFSLADEVAWLVS